MSLWPVSVSPRLCSDANFGSLGGNFGSKWIQAV